MSYGISFDLTLEWINNYFESIEFSDNISDYLYEDKKFYLFIITTDEQESNYVLMEDSFEIAYAEHILLKNNIVVSSFLKYVEEKFFEISEQGDFINHIKQIE